MGFFSSSYGGERVSKEHETKDCAFLIRPPPLTLFPSRLRASEHLSITQRKLTESFAYSLRVGANELS